MKTLGIYYLATGNYISGFSKFIETIQYFMPELEKTVIILSDGLEEYSSKVVNGVNCKVVKIDHYPWPIITLYKMYHIYRNKGNYDFVMYCDSTLNYYKNTLVDFRSWIDSGKIILTRHAMCNMMDDDDGRFFNCYPKINSKSYIDPNTSFKYVQAGFFFGPSRLVYKMCNEIIEWTNEDMRSGVIPKWHDETYLNRWQIDNQDLVDNSNKVISLGPSNNTVFILNHFDKDKNLCKIKELNIAMTNGRFGNIIYPLMVGITYAKKYNISDINVFEVYPEHLPEIMKKPLSNVFDFGPHSVEIPLLDIFYTCSKSEQIPRYNKEIVTIGGYLQNSELIDEDFCREIFKCPDEIKDKIKNTYGNLDNVVGLSVRRGDYVNHSIYQTLSVEFIERMVDKYYKGRTILCCSDDIEWCKENLSHIPGIIFQEIVEDKILIDWFILTMTWSNILSCSSFSQSAGLLNPRKHCIVPTPYFKPEAGMDWNDLLVPKFAIREPLEL